MLSPRVRRVTRAASVASLALGLIPAGGAAAKSGPAKPSSGGASMGATRTAQVSDSHRYLGDSQHLGDRVLRSGMSGHDVRVLQDFLTRAGFPTPVIGHFGPTTRRNVVAFQRAHHLQATGVVTWAIAQALRAAVGASHTSVQSASTPTVPGSRGTISHGLAIAPADAPASVKAVIAAGNRIAFKPYIYGGGHGSWNDSGYDCSGSVSYALHGGGLLSSPEDSGTLESYGRAGRGNWITIWANGGHVFMYVAGLRFDTSAQGDTGGSRWTSQGRSSSGYVVRHPSGL